MIDPNQLQHVRAAIHSQTLLYVEDNVGLNTQATQLFEKIFDTVLSAHDGEEGLQLFTQHRPKIVITDIKMPRMDGIEMAKKILQLEPETKIIITTAHNENELLHDAIRLGAFDYLIKPITIQNILDVLVRCADVFRSEMHQKLFHMYLNNIFNYQQNLVSLIHREEVVMANQQFLDFFAASSIEIFQKTFADFKNLLLEHSGFLYNHDSIEWFHEVKSNPGKLFNVKLGDVYGSSHHFVLNLQIIPDKEDYFILSLNDVSELNLLKLFDASAVEKEAIQKDQKALLGLFEMAKRNNAKITLHNLYKGLSIVNDGIIDSIDEKVISIKTSFLQLKAIQYEKRVVLVSDIFPMFIELSNIKKINFEQQVVSFETYRMSSTSPTRRQYMRVPPEEESRATILYQGHRFDTDVSLIDVSVVAAKLSISSLPSGFQLDSIIILDLILGKTQPIIINTEAKVFRIVEQSHHYEVVFMYEVHGQKQKNLVDYIAKRQLTLIREFKGMQHG